MIHSLAAARSGSAIETDAIRQAVALADAQTVVAIEQDVVAFPDDERIAATLGEQARFKTAEFLFGKRRHQAGELGVDARRACLEADLGLEAPRLAVWEEACHLLGFSSLAACGQDVDLVYVHSVGRHGVNSS